MKRYAETFFRYWLIIIVPIVVLPVAEYAMTRHTPKTVIVSQNVWVDQSLAAPSATYNQWLSPAQNEQVSLNQLLQSSSFDLDVARGSAIYRKTLASMNAYQQDTVVATDLLKNLQVTARSDWPNLVNISYTSKDWLLGEQIVASFLTVARTRTESLNKQQTDQSLQYYTYQLHDAQQREAQSAKALSNYIASKGYAPTEVIAQMSSDPTLASLSRQNQSDQQDVANAQAQVSKLHAQQVPGTVVDQAPFQVWDSPSVTAVSTKKQQIMDLAIALILGLLLGGGFMVVKTALDRSLRYADEVPMLLDLPLLAVIPYSDALAKQRVGGAQTASKAMPQRRLLGARRAG